MSISKNVEEEVKDFAASRGESQNIIFVNCHPSNKQYLEKVLQEVFTNECFKLYGTGLSHF